MGVFIIKETSKINKICGFAGQIKSFRWPHLARGPYVVHAWIKITITIAPQAKKVLPIRLWHNNKTLRKY